MLMPLQAEKHTAHELLPKWQEMFCLFLSYTYRFAKMAKRKIYAQNESGQVSTCSCLKDLLEKWINMLVVVINPM